MQPIPKLLQPGEPMPKGYELRQVRSDGTRLVVKSGLKELQEHLSRSADTNKD